MVDVILGPSLGSQHSLREGLVYSPSIPQERAKLYLPAFLERVEKLFRRIQTLGFVLKDGFTLTAVHKCREQTHCLGGVSGQLTKDDRHKDI